MVVSAGNRSGRLPALTKYEVLDELGHGGMATVFRAHDKRLARDVAIKVLHPHLRESREIAHRFAVEAKAVAKLRHPNIVEVFDVSSEEDPEQYLVVELIRGETLRKTLQKRGALPPEVVAAIVLELLAALSHAHASGVVHRDVKPENVLVEHRPSASPAASEAPAAKDEPPSPHVPVESRRGERVIVKLTDFGIAKLLDAQGVTSTGQVLGSPAHMAPEQIEGGEVDGRADVFGLGVLMYEAMVGHLPFEGSNPAQVLRRVLDGAYPPAERERPTVGKAWSLILDRALARDAEARFPDANAMRDAIAGELARLGVTSPRAALESWFDDPEGWTAAHDERLIAKLCDLGAASRRAGDAVKAAADYNRALAHAPHDTELLRLVAKMHQDEARRRLLRRAVPLVVGAAVFGTAAFFVARALKATPDAAAPEGSPRVVATGGATTSAVASSRAIAPAGGSVARPVVSVIGQPRPGDGRGGGVVAASPPKRRAVTLATLRPPFGVHLSIDGAAAPDPTQGTSLALDDRAHVLAFSCERDMCEPRTFNVGPSDRDETLVVELRVLPARLLVEGDSSHSYAIEEIPTVIVGAGVATEIPMQTGQRTVTVFDRIDPSRRVRVSLRAGQQERVALARPPPTSDDDAH